VVREEGRAAVLDVWLASSLARGRRCPEP